MDAWKNASVLQEKSHAHKIPRFRGEGILGFGGGGGEVPILFLWARGFCDSVARQDSCGGWVT